MKCKDCVFCKRAMFSNYVKDVDFYRCDMDNDIILDPRHEGEDCAWAKSRKQKRPCPVKRWLNEHCAQK